MDYSYFNNIVTALDSVTRPGFYATGGVCSMPLPSLSINNAPAVILGLPLSEGQAKAIVTNASRAPFGRGEDTIVDVSVRCTWQLSPTQFSINNDQWSEQLLTLLDKVTADLGCDTKMTVTCELYKLLLYEPGGFFKRHRDTEKSDGMFGTLVIQLPSNFSGGQLLVYHQSKSLQFDFGGLAGCNSFHYAAFYADCQHEIKPVTEGYRLCLIYNLMYSGSGGCPTPANNQQVISDIVCSMTEWIHDPDSPLMMTYLLEHQYCDASLSFEWLKNADRAVADVLVQANNEVNFELYLAKVNLSQNWSACGGYSHRYGGFDYTAEDLINEHVKAENLTSHHGASISTINIDKEYFVPEDFLESADPDEEEFEEATGNEGATLDKQYSWAALLLWPSKKCSSVIGIANTIGLLEQDLHDPTISQDRKTGLEVVAKDLIQSCVLQGDSDVYIRILQCLQVLGNLELILLFLEVISSSKSVYSCLIGRRSFSSKILTIGRKYGWNTLRSPLQAIFDKASSSNHNKYLRFLHGVSDHLLSKDKDHKDICEGLASNLVNALSKRLCTNVSKHCDQKAYVLFLQSLQSLGNVELILRFLEVVASSEVFHHSLIESQSFISEIVAVGRKYTWSALKSPLQIIFDRLSSTDVKIEKYCKFLHAISHEQPSDPQKVVCRDFASVVLNSLSKEHGVSSSQPEAFVSFLQCLQILEDSGLISQFLEIVTASGVLFCCLIESSSFASEILSVGSKYGWNILKVPLQVVSGKVSSSIEKYCRFLYAILCNQPCEALKSVCQCLVTAIVSALSNEQDTKPTRHGHSSSGVEFLIHLIKFLISLEYNEQLLSLVLVLCTKPNRYPVLDILAPACEDVYKLLKEGERQSVPFQQLLSYCISSLKGCSFPSPTDWCVPVTLSCSCEDCAVLVQFLRHPTEAMHRFRMIHRKRTHLEQQLDILPVVCTTERFGTPHTLLVT